MTRDELLSTMRAERARWEALLAAIGDERMTEPGAEDAWSVCDVVAHITSYERWLADQLAMVLGRPASQRIDAGMRPGAQQKSRRAPSHGQTRQQVRWPLLHPETRDEAAREFARLLDVVALLPEEALAERNRYQWSAGQPLWRAIASDCVRALRAARCKHSDLGWQVVPPDRTREEHLI